MMMNHNNYYTMIAIVIKLGMQVLYVEQIISISKILNHMHDVVHLLFGFDYITLF